MTLPLTKENLQAAYDFLSTTEPFNKWNLPEGDDVVFSVIRDPKLRGYYIFENKRHRIYVSASTIGHTQNLIGVMAHEMIHLHEQEAGMCRQDVEHSAAFKKLAARVCKIHGFDPKLF